MPRGSIWQKWDLHLHTPYSVLNNQFGDPNDGTVWETYVSTIETKATELGVAAIGVTDYFTIEGYKRLCQFQADGRLAGILLLPNIEFRVDKIIYRSKGGQDPKRLNVHVLFAPEVAPEQIEEHFLHDLDFVYESDPFQPSNTRKLKLSNLDDFGQQLQSQHPSFRGQPTLEIGCMNAIVQVDQMKERLERDNRFRGKYLIVLADEDLSLMDWNSQDHATRKHLIQMSHAIFSSNERTRTFCLGNSHPSYDAYVTEFKSLKPCIWGCDSHGLQQRFLEPDGQRYCWIKGEPSWEGLKQVLYEPDERVRIQAREPEHPKSFFTLEHIEICPTAVNPALCLEGLNVELNPNLITIIGGRGSGKTALLDLIATCFRNGAQLVQKENSFFYRLYGKKTASPANAVVPVKIRFKSGEEFNKSVGKDTGVFENADILYLTQNHIEDYTANPSKLNTHIIDLVFEKNAESQHEYKKLLGTAAEHERSIQSLNLEIDQLGREIFGKLESEEVTRRQKEGELADFTQRLCEQQEQQQGVSQVLEELNERLKTLKTRRQRLNTAVVHLEDLSKLIGSFSQQYERLSQQVNLDIAELADSVSIRQFPTQLIELTNILSLIQANKDSLRTGLPETEEQIQDTANRLNQFEGAERIIADLHRSIQNIKTELSDIEQRIVDIQEKQKRILTIKETRLHTYASLMLSLIVARNYLQEMISAFERDRDNLLSSLSFTAIIDTSKQDVFVHNLFEKVDARATSEEQLSHQLAPTFAAFNDFFVNTKVEDAEEAISNLLPTVEVLTSWAENLRRKRAVSESDFLNAVLSPYSEIGLDIRFNGRLLQSLSMGERAVVLLKILLSLDDKPLLIDQPEEHLDNRYIYDELIPAFRRAKTRRQIIIATHNANLVVNTDAEQIIIAEHVNGKLSYKVGTLENLSIRDSIKAILEGGDQAFKKREEKYGYRF